MNNKEKKIKVVFTIFDLHFGGISNLMLHTMPSLSKELDIQLIYFGRNEKMLPFFLQQKIKVTRIKYNGLNDIPIVLFTFIKYIKTNKITHVCSNLTIDKLIVFLASKFVKFKNISTLHSVDNPYTDSSRSKLKSRFEDYFHNNATDINLFVSEASLKSWQLYRNFNATNHIVLYPGMYKLECEYPNKKSNISDKIIFVTACRFSKEKGLDRLINLFGTIESSSKPWELWLIGDGYLKEELELQVKENNLENRIKFLGFQKELSKLYVQADYYVNASLIEALSVSIVEAMSIGLPCLGSNVGGIPEVVEHDYNGWLLDFSNEDQTRELLCQILQTTKEEYEYLSLNAIKTFENKFSIGNYVNNFNKIIHNV